MENAGIWISIIIVAFLLGTILNFRTSPKDKALANIREKARKMGLNPRLIPAPEWLGLAKNGTYAQMVAYYSVIIPEGKFALMRAVVNNQTLNVQVGNEKFQNYPVAITGAFAVEMQANSVSLYWDELADKNNNQLENVKQFLMQLAESA